MNLLSLALVAIGGAIGSVSRYVLSTAILRVSGSLFPVGTFAVNLIGCIAFGAIIGAAEQRFIVTPEARTFLLVGVLGGFTTFSSFAFESFALMQDGQFVLAALNIAGQIEIVDAPEKIEAMVGDGLITLERDEVLLYRPGRTSEP